MNGRIKQNLQKRNFMTHVLTMLMAATTMLGCSLQVQAAPAAKVSGNASVVIYSYSVSHSAEAEAVMHKKGEDQVVMQADLSMPGEWACFEFTVENTGNVEAILSKVIRADDTPEDILVSFGISDKDVGETLKPGEKCKISIVVQVDPKLTDDLSTNGDFSLTLVYKASALTGNDDDKKDIETGEKSSVKKNTPKTGDRSYLPFAVAGLLLSVVMGMVVRKMNHSESV